jgi:hypothetical protein
MDTMTIVREFGLLPAIHEFRFATIVVYKFTGFSSVFNLSKQMYTRQNQLATINFPQVKMDLQTNVGT